MVERLTPAEHRVLQALLNLPAPVSLSCLDLAAANGKIRQSRLAEQQIQKIKRKRLDLTIQNQRGVGYHVKVGKLCECGNNCERGERAYRSMCRQCDRMYRRGYEAAKKRFSAKEVDRRIVRVVQRESWPSCAVLAGEIPRPGDSGD